MILFIPRVPESPQTRICKTGGEKRVLLFVYKIGREVTASELPVSHFLLKDEGRDVEPNGILGKNAALSSVQMDHDVYTTRSKLVVVALISVSGK